MSGPPPIVNVVRYGALVFGIGYGIVHRRTLQRKQDAAHAAHEASKQERWIAEAKEEWRKKQENSWTNSAGSLVGSAVEELEKLLKSGAKSIGAK